MWNHKKSGEYICLYNDKQYINYLGKMIYINRI